MSRECHTQGLAGADSLSTAPADCTENGGFERDTGEAWELYQEAADQFARDRVRFVGEQAYLDRLLERLGGGRAVLDMGCGGGVPIARYLIGRGCAVTGIDAAPRMIEICRERFPEMTWLVQDMRQPVLGRRFDAIIAWDSFFHLNADDQRRMFDVFAGLAAPGGLLLFTSGPEAGEAIGDLYGHRLYHASLSPEEYRRLLRERGFEALVYRAEDHECSGHTVWLAQRQTSGSAFRGG